MQKLREYMRGWVGYFGISEYYKPIPPLDQWILRRVRMCYWKMWCRNEVETSCLKNSNEPTREVTNPS